MDKTRKLQRDENSNSFVVIFCIFAVAFSKGLFVFSFSALSRLISLFPSPFWPNTAPD